MTAAQTITPARRRPLRLWPGIAAAVFLVLARYAMPAAVPWTWGLGLIGGVAGVLAILAWWLLLSRAPWLERIGAIGLMALGVAVTSRFVHESLAGGMQGFLFPVYAVPALAAALVAWAAASSGRSAATRGATLLLTVAVACGAFALLRTEGVTGETGSQFAWRWSRTPEERLLAQAGNEFPAPAQSVLPTPAPPAPAESARAGAAATLRDDPNARPAPPPAAPAPGWPGFRGPGRNSVVRGVRIQTDWSKTPPVQLWRRPIGPGWSSFAVAGDLLYTQEQRGQEEIVACYRVSTGEPVWKHSDPVRFWESNGGAGPRATPTLSHGRVYTLGATGILNALEAGSGAVVWSRNAASDTGTDTPTWGFAGSPLVDGDLVIVAVAGRLAAYDLASGRSRWVGPDGGGGYSSPHLVTVGGVAQVLLLGTTGATSVDPATGTVLWQHEWSGGAIVQPAQAEGGDVLINSITAMGGLGIRRLAVAPPSTGVPAGAAPGGWTVQERWTSPGLKPYFNDFVVHRGHAFGFDGAILSCIDLEDGRRVWKGGRYGNGQLVLLPDQDVLLVLSEEGELALVGAATDGFRELARVPAIDGKTWNHPVLVGDVLLVRNGEEMAAFRLPLAAR